MSTSNKRVDNCTVGSGKNGRQTAEQGVDNRAGGGCNNQILMRGVKASRFWLTAAYDGWQKGVAAGDIMVNDCTTVLGAVKSGRQQQNRLGATTPHQRAAPVVAMGEVNASILLLQRGRCIKCCTKRKRLSNGRWQRLTRQALAAGKPHHLALPSYS